MAGFFFGGGRGGAPLPPLWGEGERVPSNTKSPGPTPSFIPSDILIHAAIWQQQIWTENWEGCAPLGEGELGPHLQCGQGRGLHAYSVSSWSVQSFGHSARTLQTTGQTGQAGRQRSDNGRAK